MGFVLLEKAPWGHLGTPRTPRDTYRHLETLGDTWGHPGVTWSHLGTPKDTWGHVGASGDTLRTPGDTWGHLETLGDTWGRWSPETPQGCLRPCPGPQGSVTFDLSPWENTPNTHKLIKNNQKCRIGGGLVCHGVKIRSFGILGWIGEGWRILGDALGSSPSSPAVTVAQKHRQVLKLRLQDRLLPQNCRYFMFQELIGQETFKRPRASSPGHSAAFSEPGVGILR